VQVGRPETYLGYDEVDSLYCIDFVVLPNRISFFGKLFTCQFIDYKSSHGPDFFIPMVVVRNATVPQR